MACPFDIYNWYFGYSLAIKFGYYIMVNRFMWYVDYSVFRGGFVEFSVAPMIKLLTYMSNILFLGLPGQEYDKFVCLSRTKFESWQFTRRIQTQTSFTLTG